MPRDDFLVRLQHAIGSDDSLEENNFLGHLRHLLRLWKGNQNSKRSDCDSTLPKWRSYLRGMGGAAALISQAGQYQFPMPPTVDLAHASHFSDFVVRRLGQKRHLWFRAF